MKGLRLLCLVTGMIATPAVAAPASRTPPPPPIGADSAGMFFVSYPERSLQRNEQGVVRYRVNVDLEGAASDCSVIQSSGFVRLDRLTCAAVVQHARFAPTLDERGQRTRAVYEGRVDWRLR